MAKSFHTILSEKTIEVSHLGEKELFDLPQWLTEAATILSNEQELLLWAQENEVLHGLLHSGIQQEIIRIRAASRPTINSYADTTKYEEALKKIDNPDHYHTNARDCQISKKISCDFTAAQQRINDYVCKEVKKPGSKKAAISHKDAIAKLVADGLTNEEIIAAVTAEQNKQQ